MKTKLITFFALFVTLISTSQIVKFKITAMSTRDYNDKLERWNDWKEFVDADILGLMDGENDRIKLFFEKTQTYDIIKDLGSSIDSDGDETVEWECISENGYKCGVKLVLLNSQNAQRQLYVVFNNYVLAYNLSLIHI